MYTQLKLISHYIEKFSGISISEENFYIIENRIAEVMKKYDIQNIDKLCHILHNRTNLLLIEKIVNAITINETFWFRDKATFVILEELLMPQYIKLLNEQKISKVSIWSCACSSGQEPYSIAMFIDNYLKKKNISSINLNKFEILASDICDDVLQQCSTGIYDNMSMERGIDKYYLNTYFTKSGKNWVISPLIKNAVTFKKINLKSQIEKENYFNIIFCKYVLIYFSEKNRKEILKSVLKTMRTDGTLFIGSSEIIDSHYFKLSGIEYKDSKYYTFINKGGQLYE